MPDAPPVTSAREPRSRAVVDVCTPTMIGEADAGRQ
jgi:hypothetical protein